MVAKPFLDIADAVVAAAFHLLVGRPTAVQREEFQRPACRVAEVFLDLIPSRPVMIWKRHLRPLSNCHRTVRELARGS